MPELPEVETIREGLEKKVKGKRIEKVLIENEKSIKLPSPAEFVSRIEGKVISEIKRRGKYLILRLASKDNELTPSPFPLPYGERIKVRGKRKFLYYLVIHLKLTGRLIYSQKGEKPDYTRVIFVFQDQTQLSFTDIRGFGGLWLVSDEEFWMVASLQNLGPEPLEKDFTVNKFKELLSGKRGKIKPLLMNQTFIAGIGNIYSQEALFLTGIHPKRSPSSLIDKEIEGLYNNLLNILKEAISSRGSSIDAYVDLNGKKGDYESHLRVYGRAGKNCPRCGAVIERVKIAGRGTYFCPRCQK